MKNINLANVLLSVIGALLLFFGTISVNILSKLYEKVEDMGREQAVLENEQANLKTEVGTLRADITKLQPLLSLNRLYAKPEDEDQFKPRSK